MEKWFKYSVISGFIVILSFLLYMYFRPIPILKDVTLYRHLNGYHYLYYQNNNLGYMGGLDSWYVQDNQVYGVLGHEHDENIDYFYVNICKKEILITPYYIEFEDFLDKRNINPDRRNYMSGNNIIEPDKFPYDKNIQCQ